MRSVETVKTAGKSRDFFHGVRFFFFSPAMDVERTSLTYIRTRNVQTLLKEKKSVEIFYCHDAELQSSSSINLMKWST